MTGGLKKPLGIYIHVPFCIRKCGYCGFYSAALSDDASKNEFENVLKRYANAVEKQILSQTFVPREIGSFDVNTYYVDTIFFGGGTPSLLSSESIQRILSAIDSVFLVNKDVEITVESNPGTLNLDKLNGYKHSGVNRLSIGVQSFDDGELLQIGRIHDSKSAIKTIETCRIVGFQNINLDLIFSLPNQHLDGWTRNLKTAISLSPEHLSIYGLQLEEGTEFFERFSKGEFDETSDDLDREMYHKTCDMLKSNGFEHYEISNWSKPSYECRHNLKYWQFGDYLGIGPSAASFVNGFRFEVAPSVADFMSPYESNETNDSYAKLTSNLFSNIHQNTLSDSAGEFAFTALRTTEGISFKKFKEEFGLEFMNFYEKEIPEIEYFKALSDVKIDEEGLRLTRRGIDVSNRIMALFV